MWSHGSRTVLFKIISHSLESFPGKETLKEKQRLSPSIQIETFAIFRDDNRSFYPQNEKQMKRSDS